MAIDWDGPAGRMISDRLESDDLVWLTTVAANGTPQPSLVWFWWDGTEVLVYSGETPRLANIERNPRVALNFNSSADGGDVSVITGSARIDRSRPAPDHHAEYVAKYRVAIEDGLGMSLEEFGESYAVPIVITPVSGRAW